MKLKSSLLKFLLTGLIVTLTINTAFSFELSSSDNLIQEQNTINDSSSKKAYKLASGDKVRIQVYGEADLTIETPVGDNGKISYPFLGEINLAGLTPIELENLITSGLKGPYLLDPKVTVSIVQYRSFFIGGEVKKPGGYPYQPGLTLRRAVALAGGLTEFASEKNVTIIRESDPENTPWRVTMRAEVYPGDSIKVNKYKSVYINGEVKSPGSFSYRQGLTLRKAIALAGGFTARSSKENIQVIHDDENREPGKLALDDELQPGDIVTVLQSFF